MTMMQCKNWRCGALYKRGGWSRGYDRADGSTKPREFVWSGDVADDVCPVCRVHEGTEIKNPHDTAPM